MLRRGFLEQTAGRLFGKGCKILLDSFASSPRPVRFAEIPYTFRQRHTGESKLDAAVVVDSLDYSRFFGNRREGEVYPEIKRFFTRLLGQRLGYGIIFDRTSRTLLRGAYPRDIEFLHNRIVVLERSPRRQ